MNQEKNEVTFKGLFLPLTTKKAIYWILIIGLIVFLNGLFNKFIGDDDGQITQNIYVQSISNVPKFFIGSTFYNGGTNLTGVYYKPLMMTIFSIIYTFFGAKTLFFHLFQLFFHITNTILLFLILKHFFKKTLAYFLSLIFLVHPINSEAVLYISAMQDTLFFLFGILGLLLIIYYKSNKHLILASLFFFLSLLSKETGLLFIIMSLIYILLFNKKNIFKQLGLSFLIPLLYFILRIVTAGGFNNPLNAPITKANFLERLITMPAIFFLYIKNFIFPVHISSSYQFVYRAINLNTFFLPLLIDIILMSLIVFFAYVLCKKKLKKTLNIYIFFSLWFIVGILFHLQIVPLDYTASDRWFYFPIVGVLGIIGVLSDVFILNKSSKSLIILTGVLILLLSTRTIVRSFDWRNEFALTTHDIKISKDAYDLENRIGNEYFAQGQFDQARIHFERSVQLYPYLTNYNSLGNIYLTMGKYEKAKNAYLRALTFGDIYFVYHNLAMLGIVSESTSKTNIGFVQNALQKYPQDVNLWLYLAVLEYENFSTDSAKIAISNARNIAPDNLVNDVYYRIMNSMPLYPRLKKNN